MLTVECRLPFEVQYPSELSPPIPVAATFNTVSFETLIYFDQPIQKTGDVTGAWKVRYNNTARNAIGLTIPSPNILRVATTAAGADVGANHVWFSKPPQIVTDTIQGLTGIPVRPFELDLTLV